MKERIKAVRKALNLTQAEFGSRVSLKANTITGYENGLRNPNDAIISAICKEYSVNEAWLRNGTGEMFQKETDTEMVDRILQGRNEFAKSIFRSFANMEDKDWEAWKRVADILIKARNAEQPSQVWGEILTSHDESHK